MRRDYEYFKNYRENMTFLKNTSKIVISALFNSVSPHHPYDWLFSVVVQYFSEKQLEARITFCWETWR